MGRERRRKLETDRRTDIQIKNVLCYLKMTQTFETLFALVIEKLDFIEEKRVQCETTTHQLCIVLYERESERLCVCVCA
jgi:hypothetical protein